MLPPGMNSAGKLMILRSALPFLTASTQRTARRLCNRRQCQIGDRQTKPLAKNLQIGRSQLADHPCGQFVSVQPVEQHGDHCVFPAAVYGLGIGNGRQQVVPGLLKEIEIDRK